MKQTPPTSPRRRTQRFWPRALVTTLLLSFAQVVAANERTFSAPTTEPEKALHAILRWEEQDFERELKLRSKSREPRDDLRDFLLQRPERNSQRDRKFQSKFTDALVRSISAADQVLRTADCDGICGLDFDPVVCGQEFLYPPHFYLTTNREKGNGWPDNLAATANRAYVRYRSGKASNPDPRHVDYLMEKQMGRWKIAGIYCVPDRGYGGSKFNIP